MDLGSKAEVFVVSNGTGFLNWDNKGAMSTGYPYWVGSPKDAKMYISAISAIAAAQNVRKCDDIDVWVCTVNLEVVSKSDPVRLPEDDPEYKEYLRLQEKFKGVK